MCSNFEPIKLDRAKWVEDQLKCRLPQDDWKPHVFKLQLAPFIFIENNTVKCELGHFGLIPSWVEAKDRKTLNTYNARSETVDLKKSYKPSWVQRKFGIVLAEKFYEPLYDDSGKISVPKAINRTDQEPTAIACIWESFIDQITQKTVRSFSMLTINADLHSFMSHFHHPNDEKRSVVIVEKPNLNHWLNATHEEARDLLKLSPDGYLHADLTKPNSNQLAFF